MITKPKLTLGECYKNLKISRNASLDEVKQAYRKLAFALHPDHNPNNPEASHNFHIVNESYVTIISYLTESENISKKKAESQKAKKDSMAQKAKEEEQRRKEKLAQKEKEREERINREKLLDERRREREKQKREESERIRLKEQMAKSEAARKAKREEEYQEMLRNDALHKEHVMKQMQAEAEKNERAKYKQETTAYTKSGKPIIENIYNFISGSSDSQSKAKSSGKIFKENQTKEQILKELLEDENAQKLYKDIYNELNAKINSEDNKNQTAQNQTEQNQTWQAQDSQQVNQPEIIPETSGDEKGNSVLQNVLEQTNQITDGIKQGLSSWLKSQINDEMELFFPASKLVAGAKLRLQIKEGWSGELQTVDLTLPADFVPGKPIRLKGMGKKVGKWKGDLYLKLKIR